MRVPKRKGKVYDGWTLELIPRAEFGFGITVHSAAPPPVDEICHVGLSWPEPPLWNRFWARLLLGWRFRRVWREEKK